MKAKIWQKIKRLPIMVPIFKAMHPFYGTCLNCGLPWPSCNPSHTVDMVECTDDHCGEGFFPVCEYCWQHAGLPAILTAVRRLHNMWLQQDCHPYDIDDMIEATKRDYFKESEDNAPLECDADDIFPEMDDDLVYEYELKAVHKKSELKHIKEGGEE